MRILSYDIESTTGSHCDGSMCTFGYVISNENFEILEQKDVVMRPYTRRYEGRIKLHYDKAFIKSQEQFPTFYNEIKSLFDTADLVIGFSVSNDVDFLNNACQVYKLPKILYSFYDVQLLYKTVKDQPNMAGLEGVAKELSIDYLAHRSDEDARVTLLVLKNLCNAEGKTIQELIRKYHITAGVNDENETTPCTNGTYTHKEINYLLSDFIEKNRRHSRRYKGGLSFKCFAFSDELRYGDVDLFRKMIKKVYDLNGRVGQIETSNVFVSKTGELGEKETVSINRRNENKKRITVINLSDFLQMLGDLPDLDFSGDEEMIKQHRREIRKQRELRRMEKRKEHFKRIAQEKKEQNPQ